jgi:hypothetical protein
MELQFIPLFYRNMRICLPHGGRNSLRVFESSALKKIIGSRWVEITGDWRRLHKEKLLICTLHQVLFG